MTARGRWGQLSYTSFDRMDGRGGGWQVKDTTGGLTEQETTELHGRVQTQLDTGSELPRFPTPAEIAELPRKLLYAPAGTTAGQCASWHVAPAGNDASGRPGNVFAHVLLDRDPDCDDPLRPVERWRSDGWLTPFGPEAVLAAELTDTEPPAPGVLNRTTVASWLFAPRKWRMQNLAGLLDALRAALAGGPPVVLGVEDLDEGANWIAAASFAMSAGTARRLFFSTLERPSSLAETLTRGVRLACVPASDLPALKRRQDVVLIDTTDLVELGDLDGAPHRTTRGDEIRVTEWSVLVAELFDSAENLAAAVSDLDEVAQQVGDHGLDPAWPVAMVLSRRTGGGGVEVSRVLTGCAPPQLRAVPELFQSALSMHRNQVGADTEAAWQQVLLTRADDPNAAPTVSGEVAVQVYAERALSDVRWLAAGGPARLPSAQYYSPTPDEELVAQVQAALPHWRGGGPVAVLHGAELALRLGLAHDEGVLHALWQAATESLLPVLLDRSAAGALLGQVGSWIAPEARGWLWSQLVQTPIEHLGPAGHRLAPGLLSAIGPGPDDPDPLQDFLHWLEQGDPASAYLPGVLVELAAGRDDDDARLVGAWGALQAYRHGDRQALHGLTSRFWPLWPVRRISLLEKGFGELPGQAYLPELLGRESEAAAVPGWRRLAHRNEAGPVPVLARTRLRLDSTDWLSAAEPAAISDGLHVLVDTLEELRRSCPDFQPDKELVRRAQVWAALALLAGRAGGPAGQRLEVAAGRAQSAWHQAGVGEPPELTEDELVAAQHWCQRERVDAQVLTTLLLLGDRSSPLHRDSDRAAAWLQGVTVGGSPLAAALLRAALTRDAESRERVGEQMLQAVRRVPGSADERDLRQAERFVTGWLRQAVRRR
ncbi:hypothetical protein CGZ93_16190 [Enemella dayhoffiae]|uniref:Uncharacterized protein n=1 Tax=Enemella dayhoffiae TaxID=2016507 RepID=A0A255GWY9_9ACTN|nr:hypothetical protein [Enemella dayhoffiae]OYO18094.1 hypothetical protein CGZ93_16190 [Enemella dayhoffiae]